MRDDGGVDVGRRQVETDQFLRIDPDAHRPFGAIQLRLADTVQTLDLVHHVARQVITERHIVEFAVTGGQGDQQQETGGNFFDLQALLNNCLWQTRLDHLKTVLHIDLSHFRVSARLKRGFDGGAAKAALRLEIQQMVGAVEFFLDQADHALVDGLRRSPGYTA